MVESLRHSKSLHNQSLNSPEKDPSFSKVFCDKHPAELVTNFCCGIDCLKALCPDCIDLHNKYHRQNQAFPEIDSLKNVKRNCSKKIKAGINVLTQELEKLELKYLINPQDIVDEGIDLIRRNKEKLLQIINTFFEGFEAEYKRNLNEFIFKGQDFNTLFEKIRNFINELEFYLANLESNNALTIIKKICLLDLKSLIDKYRLEIQGLIDVKMTKTVDIQINESKFKSIEKELKKLLTIQQNNEVFTHLHTTGNKIASVRSHQLNESYEAFSEKKSRILTRDPDFPISIPDYLEPKSQKFLHFFQNDSKFLYLLNIEELNQNAAFNQIPLNIPFKIPHFHKSIISPKGNIYLVGGTSLEQNKKISNIYLYDHKTKELKTIGNMLNPRSSHSICYHRDIIYIIGGFLNRQEFTTTCETFDLKREKSNSIANLNISSGVPGVCSFNDRYIFKFGGITEGLILNNNIERYDITYNCWEIIDAKFDTHDPLRIDLKAFALLSTCCCVQINNNEIFVFGGYKGNNESSSLSFVLGSETDERNETDYQIKWINYKPLIEAEGFWNNTPIIMYKKVFALQNISNDKGDDCLENVRRVVCFNSNSWKNY